MRDGSTQYVLALARLGYTDRDDVRRRVMDRFNLGWSAADAAIGRASRARVSAGLFRALGADGRLRAKDIGDPDPGCLRWQYSGYVPVMDEAGQVIGRSFQVTFNASASPTEVVERLSQAATAYYNTTSARDSEGYPVQGNFVVMADDVFVQAVERVCA